MVRNSGKFGKPKRGSGAKRFTPARQLGQDNAERAGMWDGAAKEEDEESSEESSEEEDEDEESNDDSDGMGGTLSGAKTVTFGGTSSYPDAAPSSTSSGARAPTVDPANKFAISAAEADRLENPTLTKREQKKLALEAEARAKAAKKEKSSGESESSSSSEEEVPLPKRGGGAGLAKPMKLASLGAPTQQARKEPEKKPEPQAMNRREREEAQKKAARERYLEMHRAGKTDEAKSDLARLAKIRKDREEAAARKKAEQEEANAVKEKALAASGRKK